MTYNVFSGTLNPTHSHSLTPGPDIDMVNGRRYRWLLEYPVSHIASWHLSIWTSAKSLDVGRQLLIVYRSELDQFVSQHLDPDFAF